MRPPENAILPCGHCGAPMVQTAGRAVDVQVQLECEYCGRVETLPADEAARVVALRIRQQERKWAKDAGEGRSAGLLRWLDANAPNVKVYLAVGLGLVACGVAATANGGLPFMILPGAIVFGGALGAYLVLAPVKRRLLRVLAPLLAPRAPLEGTQSFACRWCGGELPQSLEGFVRCVYCSAQNLASRDAFAERDRLVSSTVERQWRSTLDAEKEVARLVASASFRFTAGVLLGSTIALTSAVASLSLFGPAGGSHGMAWSVFGLF